MISHPVYEIACFCDSNFFINPTDDSVWMTLLEKPGRLILADVVYHELRYWLAAPKYNHLVHAAVKARLNGEKHSPVKILGFPRSDTAKIIALEYYTNLLGLRRDAYQLAGLKLQEQMGRKPTRQEASNYCKDTYGGRTQLLARKRSQAKVLAHKHNDEALVTMAIMYAVYRGQEVMILTKDEHLFEQFYKALWLIDTHYRSMLMAEHYASDPFLFRTRRLRGAQTGVFKDVFAGEEVLLLEKPSSDLEELLPREFTFVPVYCILVQGNGMTAMTFCAEREMRRVFDMKGKSGGLSTDKLDGRNCHVFLGDRFIERYGNPAAIGYDVSIPVRSARLSVIDMNLALVSDEHWGSTRFVDPKRLILPPGRV